MADTATAEPESPSDSAVPQPAGTGDLVLLNTPQPAPDPAPQPRSSTRRRPQAVPLLVHATNATGIGVGLAYSAAGVPGLMAAGAAGAAIGAAALAGRKKRSSAPSRRSAAQLAGSSGGASRAGGGLLGNGTGRGGGASGAGGGRRSGSRSSGAGTGSRTAGGQHNGRRGSGQAAVNGRTHRLKGRGLGLSGQGDRLNGPRPRLNGAGDAVNARGAKTSQGSGARNWTGKAGRTLKGWAGKLRRTQAGPATAPPGAPGGTQANGGAPGSAGTSASPTARGGGLRKTLRAWAGRLRRTAAAKAAPIAGRIYRMRRQAARTVRHAARMSAAGLLAAVAGVLTLPAGIVWGLWRTTTGHRDPLHAFAYPVRLALRIWRTFYRRSKARVDLDARADELTLTVTEPRKDTDPVSGPTLAGSHVLDGRTSKFALAMGETHAAYTGYRPQSMMEVAAEYAGLPNGFRAAAGTVRDMAVNCDQKWPCSKRAIAKLVEAVGALEIAAARSEAMNTLFRTVHKFDIARFHSPRTNEFKWNVTEAGSSAADGAMFLPGRIEAGCVLMATLYRTFEPTHMMEVGSEYLGMGLGLRDLASALQALRERTRDVYPVDGRVVDELGALLLLLQAAADHATLAGQLFLEDHHLEISHNTHPRKGLSGEAMWNTPRY